MEYYLKAVRDNYANFNGRAGRKDYWYFVLWNIIFSGCASLLDTLLLGFNPEYVASLENISPTNLIYSLIVFIPSLAVFVRRMHDIGKSGWYFLIPIYGQLILTTRNGDVGDNNYGSDPK